MRMMKESTHNTMVVFSNLNGAFQRLALLLRASNGLLTHDATAPVTLGLLVFVRVTFLDGGDELGQLGFVFGSDFG